MVTVYVVSAAAYPQGVLVLPLMYGGIRPLYGWIVRCIIGQTPLKR